MPPKITAKNLQYNQILPPFLAKLRGEEANARSHGGPDPILAAQRRIGKPRSASAEAEDAPLVVDEHGNVVDLAALEDGADEGGDGTGTNPAAGEEENKSEGPSKEGPDKEGKKEESGISGLKKKRKLGKVVGAERDDEHDEEGGSKKATATEKSSSSSTKPKSGNDKKKKTKKIKLSFYDDEEEG